MPKYLGEYTLPSVLSLMPFATETYSHCSGHLPGHPLRPATLRGDGEECPLCGSTLTFRPSTMIVDRINRVCAVCHGFAWYGLTALNLFRDEVYAVAFRFAFSPVVALPVQVPRGGPYIPFLMHTIYAHIRADAEMMRLRAAYRTGDFQFKLYTVPAIGWVDILEDMGCPRAAGTVNDMCHEVPADDVDGAMDPRFHNERARIYWNRPLRIFEGDD